MKFKIKLYFILGLIFAILTIIGGYMVITHKLNNAGYALVPMVFAVAFMVLYRNSKGGKG